jgi:hypothetical protein
MRYLLQEAEVEEVDMVAVAVLEEFYGLKTLLFLILNYLSP